MSELRRLKEIVGYALLAEDGEIGRCQDFLFDDADWVVRWLVAETGKWIPQGKVLIAPNFLGEPDWSASKLPISLTKHEIEAAPPLEQEDSVSRQHEEALAQHYRIPRWWGSSEAGAEPLAEAALEAAGPEAEDRHLRSLNEVEGYHVQATDGEVGHVEDLMVDDGEWAIRYLVVDTRNWLPGRKVLVSPRWLRELLWAEQKAVVDLTRKQIEESPRYEPREPIYRAYEAELHEEFGHKGYWET